MKRSVASSVDMETDESFNGFESDEDAISMLSKRFKTNEAKQISQQSKVSRKPTRKPDPSVTNRNALMARENRRKHKEKLTQLETENETLFERNVALERQLKVKDLIIKDLRREFMHLKSVIANKTQITQILSSLQQATGLPMSSSLGTFNHLKSLTTSGAAFNKIKAMTASLEAYNQAKAKRENSPSTESTTSAVSGYESPTLSHGTVDSLDELLQEALESQNLTFTDYEMNANALATDDWGYLAEPNDIFSDLTTALFDDNGKTTTEDKTEKPEVGEEHNYSEPGTSDPGVCVHISNHKVSIEFCARCHNNTSGTLLTP